MADALGHQLLLDLYSCNEEIPLFRCSRTRKCSCCIELADIELDEINYQVMDDEIVVLCYCKTISLHITCVSRNLGLL